MASGIDFEVLKSKLTYLPELGLFIRKDGSVIGAKCGKYFKVGIGGKQYYTHRLAWLWMTGQWPDREIDHINRDPLDNRWLNLRLATPGQNRVNATAQKSSKSRVRGVHLHQCGRYRVQLQKAGKSYHIGYFDTFSAAQQAATEASRSLHGEYAAV